MPSSNDQNISSPENGKMGAMREKGEKSGEIGIELGENREEKGGEWGKREEMRERCEEKGGKWDILSPAVPMTIPTGATKTGVSGRGRSQVRRH